MPTFTKKVEIVDARRFEGTLKSAKELVGWVTANGGSATWSQTQEVRHDGNKVVSGVTINAMSVRTGSVKIGMPNPNPSHISVGTWILIKQNGDFDVQTDEQMTANYDQA